MSSKSDRKKDIDYLVLQEGLDPTVVKIKEDIISSTSKEEATISYSLFDKVYKGIGSFEIDKKQFISIESHVKQVQSEKLAFAKDGAPMVVFSLIEYSLLLLLSVGGMLISGISLLLLKRNKRVIINMAE